MRCTMRCIRRCPAAWVRAFVTRVPMPDSLPLCQNLVSLRFRFRRQIFPNKKCGERWWDERLQVSKMPFPRGFNHFQSFWMVSDIFIWGVLNCLWSDNLDGFCSLSWMLLPDSIWKFSNLFLRVLFNLWGRHWGGSVFHHRFLTVIKLLWQL